MRPRRLNKGCSTSRAWGGARPRRRACCSEYAGASQVWVNPFKFRPRVDLRQGLRANLDDYAFSPFDLLLRVEESRILLERCHYCLIESKSGNLTVGTCSGAVPRFAATKT